MEDLTTSLHKRSILLTGSTGFLGSVVLEQLLRVFGESICRCYVLTRGRGKTSAQERLDKLLASELFCMVREQHKDAIRKIEVVDGDLSLPNLGLQEQDLRHLSEVSVVLHCAANIKLHDTIQNLLNDNYIGTRNLLDCAAAHMPQLVAFVHTSSVSVTYHHPPGSTIPETTFPLMLGDTMVDESRLASDLLSMDPHSADVEAGYLVRRWAQRTPYVLTKRMAELLVQRYHDAGVFPCAIVRPSCIVALAGAPRPGYISNFAMFASLIAAYVNGFYSPGAFATTPDFVMDAVPADVAAGVVLGAAVALAAGIRSKQRLEAAAAAAAAGTAAAADDSSRRKATTAASPPSAAGGSGASAGTAGADTGSCGGGGYGGDIIVLHAATSATRPLPMIRFYDRMHRFFAARKPQRAWPISGLTKTSHVCMEPGYVPDPRRVEAARRAALNGVRGTGMALKLLGRGAEAKRLYTSFVAWYIINNEKMEYGSTMSVQDVMRLETLLLLPRSDQLQQPAVKGSGGDGAGGGPSNASAAALTRPLQKLQQPLLPVVWRHDWGPLLDAMTAHVVQSLMGIKLLPQPRSLL